MAEWKPVSPSPGLRSAFAQWRSVLDEKQGRRVAVFFEDREAMAGAMLAAWSLGREVVLPGDALPETKKALSPTVDVFLGDFQQAPQSVAMSVEKTGDIPGIAPETSRLTIFTSGSTGVPVALERALSQLLLEVVALEHTFGGMLPMWARVVSTVSHQHLYGLLFAVLWPLATGRSLTPRRLEFPEELRAELATSDSVLVSSPAHLKRLPADVPWSTKVHAVFSSGGPLAEPDAKSAELVLGRTPIEIYGSSETGGIAFRSHRAPRWVPLPGVGFRVNPEGLLEIRSPFLATDGWHTLSDRAQTSDDSFVLLGRVDRIAKIEEKRVSLDAVEQGLVASGWCTDARVLVLSGRRSELGAVCVLSAMGVARATKEGHRALSETLRDFLSDRLERIALPRRFRFLDELPLNAQGKVTQEDLEALFLPSRPSGRWVSKQATTAEFEFTVDPSLRVLDGHFPGLAVVPGVAQLDWAMSLARDVFTMGTKLARMESVKFLALMRPGEVVRLVLEWSAEKSTLNFVFSGKRRTFSSGQMVVRT
jgi:acyl-coenzyme A synthetase/AMP-(fatty) acid ligase/3-hydroxymyristoyl/3-hydroxydecanoyl-(acyl carrier protein) dehydratase